MPSTADDARQKNTVYQCRARGLLKKEMLYGGFRCCRYMATLVASRGRANWHFLQMSFSIWVILGELGFHSLFIKPFLSSNFLKQNLATLHLEGARK
jgi:hypothetical protein